MNGQFSAIGDAVPSFSGFNGPWTNNVDRYYLGRDLIIFVSIKHLHFTAGFGMHISKH